MFCILQCFTPNMRNSIERNPDGGKTLLDKGICPGWQSKFKNSNLGGIKSAESHATRMIRSESPLGPINLAEKPFIKGFD